MSDATNAPEKGSKLKKGLAIFVVLAVIGTIFGGPTVKIEGGTAKVSQTVMHGIGLKHGASYLLDAVFEAVHAHPEITRLEATLYVQALGLSDRYGNAMKDDVAIGQVVFERPAIEEFLKFKEKSALTQDDYFKSLVATQLSIQGNTYLLE
ncbi:MAG: hypothetical protein IPG66_06110 [Hydrogenophilales bacterium]|nr:hypothetical protein [Hydrogenophilales bacterium]